MYDRCVIAEFDNIEQARVGLEVLEKFDFTTDNVSVVSLATRAQGSDGAGHTSGEQVIDQVEAKSGGVDGSESSGLGAVLGGAIGAPIAVTTAVGPFMLFGPIAALVGGAAVGGVVGSASRWGVDPERGRYYDKKVADGWVLVIVADEDMRVREAEAALKTAHPEAVKCFNLNG